MTSERASLFQHARNSLREVRLALASWLLPSGFAIWTWGLDEGAADSPVVAKELRNG